MRVIDASSIHPRSRDARACRRSPQPIRTARTTPAGGSVMPWRLPLHLKALRPSHRRARIPRSGKRRAADRSGIAAHCRGGVKTEGVERPRMRLKVGIGINRCERLTEKLLFQNISAPQRPDLLGVPERSSKAPQREKLQVHPAKVRCALLGGPGIIHLGPANRRFRWYHPCTLPVGTCWVAGGIR